MGDLRPDDPRELGGYRLLARIGSGGMGQVFLGRSPGGRPVAIKVIRPDLADDRGFRKRFAREVASARAVNGLFTALVIDADVDGPVPWLATAYVPGPSLADAVDEHGPLPVESIRTLAAGLAESLHAIHTADIVHRDLKPSNVLLAQDGPRVIDFGISRALEGTSLTGTGEVIGTVDFMSPEQIEGGPIGPPSDVFSLGGVLVFAATGEGPFGSGRPTVMFYRVVHNAPNTSGVPDQIRLLIERCLAKDPADRPSTGELLTELQAARPAMNWLPPALIGIPDPAAVSGHEPPDQGQQDQADPFEVRLPQIRNMFAGASEQNRAAAEIDDWQRYGDELGAIHTAPEFARHLRNLGAVGRSGTETVTAWPTGTSQPDITAVRAGHVIPRQDLLDTYLTSCNIRPANFRYWHEVLDMVNARTRSILELRSRVIGLKRDLDAEAKAYRRGKSSQRWLGGMARSQDRGDLDGISRASRHGQLRGLAGALIKETDRIGELTGLYLPIDYMEWQRIGSMLSGDNFFTYGTEYIGELVERLAAIQVDASGVDLSDLNLHEPDAARGVIYTEYTKWPASIADAVQTRRRPVGPGIFQVS